ncbi:MAG: MaoC family dehydratase N-terminal domain-containing protein [Deltaproteobacteria bacterium]|jgi:acyl dehydratase|nr:MaoC family dehydratase N-terminal domain-containing protein [Deltaproteobacteria bacterium]
MAGSDVQFRYWEDVEVGEVLPKLEFPITVKTMILGVCGTRDLMPYHHDPEYSKSVGNRDMFVNTMFDQALFGRFVTDWSGPESDFRETSLQMVGSLCPGDLAVVQGRVTEKTESGNDKLVKIEMGASSEDHGLAATSTAIIAMPSRESGPVQPVDRLEKPAIEVHPEMPDFAKEWLGKTSPKAEAGYPVSEVQIMYWCDMVEDANPLYIDGDYARKSRHGGVVAPPMGLITWSMRRAGHQGVDASAPDCHWPDRKPWPPVESKGGGLPAPPGATETIAQGSTQQYGKLLRPGDRVYHTGEVVNCSPLKKTRLGPGYFQTNLDTYYNQNDEIVGWNLFSLLRYGIKE